MKTSKKRIMNFRFDRYEEMENKLEKLALKGLFLEECGPFFWTFREGTPKKMNYAISYFSEGSVFNPGPTSNQQTYFEYAEAAGWKLVTQYNQMHIFSSEADNHIPFETDEKEKLNNIKRSMKKSILPSSMIMIILFSFSLIMQFNSFQKYTVDFLSDISRMIPSLLFFLYILYETYYLITYFIWCKRSERSIELGGKCTARSNAVTRSVDTIFLGLMFFGAIYLILDVASKTSGFALMLSIIQMPVLMFVFWSSIRYFKKKKVTAAKNKVISFSVLVIAQLAYFAFLVAFIVQSGFSMGKGNDYRTISWPVTPTFTNEYRLYNHVIPLTSQDLYGPIDYDYYSYEKDVDSTFLLTRSIYLQDSLPAKDSPPEIEYEILEPQFDFVYMLTKEHLLDVPDWWDNKNYIQIDNRLFDTADAYQSYYEDNPTGEYTLFFEERIIILKMEKPLTTNQISVIKHKLKI